MSGSGRKSLEEGRVGSSLATSHHGSNSGSGGLFSFLKTELDSFVKGLSGKPEVGTPAVVACLRASLSDRLNPTVFTSARHARKASSEPTSQEAEALA